MTITDDAEQNVSKFCFIQPTVRIIFFIHLYLLLFFSPTSKLLQPGHKLQKWRSDPNITRTKTSKLRKVSERF